MLLPFTSETYSQRRSELLKSVTSGLILLLGNEEVGRNYKANIYEFRQDSTFLYYFGIEQPNLVGILDVEEGTAHLFGNDIGLDDIIWTGQQPSIADLGAKVGVEHTADIAAAGEMLQKAVQQGRSVHYLPPYRLRNAHKLEQWLDVPLELAQSNASIALIKGVVAQRSIKSEAEITEMERAVDITAVIHKALMRKARPNIQEALLAGIAKGTAVGMNGDLAYPPIVTVNGQTLHNHHHHNTLQSGQLVLVDAGAETTSRYAGDITRTFPVDDTFSNQQKEIYNIVLDAETSVIRMLRAGLAYRDMHILAAARIVEGLKGLGLMKGDTNEAVAAGAHALFFPHGLGHHIGLDVHDMEDLGEDYVGYDEHIRRSKQFGTAYLRLGKQLQAGNVITVEPGIYFIPELIDRWQSEGKFTNFINYNALDAYRDFSGIRIEDNVLITENSSRVLGDPIPKTVAEVEALRSA